MLLSTKVQAQFHNYFSRFQQFEVYLHLKAEHIDGILAQLLFLMSVVRNGNQADFQLLW